MAGARGAWIEAPYATVPCPPRPAAFTPPPTRDPRLAVRILPGLRQDEPPDVMRGEETQIAGLLAAEPGFDGVACLPGTHTKWCHVSAGEVVSFASYMTGEIFALLASQSVLRKTVAPDGWSEPDFLAGRRGRPRPPRARRRAALRACAPRRCCTASTRSRPLPALGPPDRRRARRRPPLLARPRRGADRRHRRSPPPTATRSRSAGLDARRLDATAMTRAGLAAARAQLQTERTAR